MPAHKKYSLKELLERKKDLVKRIQENSKSLRKVSPKKENIAIINSILNDQYDAKEELCETKYAINQQNILISYYIYKYSELKTELADLLLLVDSGFTQFIDRIKTIDEEMRKIQLKLEEHNNSKYISWFRMQGPEPYIMPF